MNDQEKVVGEAEENMKPISGRPSRRPEWIKVRAPSGQTYEDLNSDAGMAFLLGCRLNGYLSLELFGYQSSSVYLKESDTDYLGHSLIGLGPRINIQDIRRHSWTPWFAFYATYQSIDRYRNYCCGESPEPIYTLMDGMGHSRAFGVDIKIAKNTLLQVAVRDSSVWAGWDDPDMDDGETSAEEIYIAINFSPEPTE